MRHHIEQPGERNQHQAKAYRHASKIANGGRACPKRNNADKQEERRKRGQVEGQHLHDQRRADVRAEHRGERRNQRDKTARGEGRNYECGRRAALKNRRNAEARGESLQSSAKTPRQDSPEFAAKRALHAALHHVHAPKQQGDSASKIEKAQSPRHRLAHPLFGGPPSGVRPAWGPTWVRRHAGAVTAITGRKQQNGPKAALRVLLSLGSRPPRA